MIVFLRRSYHAPRLDCGSKAPKDFAAPWRSSYLGITGSVIDEGCSRS